MSIGRDTETWLESKFDVPFDRTTTTVVAMIGLDILWWVMVYNGYIPMPGIEWVVGQGIPMAAPGAMELGVFHVGTLGAFVDYLMMWGIMMWAMMYPVVTRFTREYAATHEGSGFTITTAVMAFLVSYHITWVLSGVVPLTFQAVLPGGIYGFTHAHTTLVIGSGLLLTGIYQLSVFKQSRLRTCCGYIESHSDDIPKALRRGFVHGISCMVICLGPFFFLMPFFGEMNFFWMVALTGVVTLERLPRWGNEIATASGIVSFLAGLVVFLVQPSLPVAFGM